jgi:galactokinase
LNLSLKTCCVNTNLTAANDFVEHLDRLRQLPEHADPSLRTLFKRQSPIYVARAPGRLDIMGGIGDYSGSLVLELPIAEAAFAAVQISHEPGVTIASLQGSAGTYSVARTITSSEWADLRAGNLEAARQFFARDPLTAWAAYIAGPVLILLRETQPTFDGGLRILIDSHVPEGKGVSSSAAVEVATTRAVAAALGIELAGEVLARLCQLAENHVAGAPCGIMDQTTSALGRENELLALRCQPATIEGFVSLPTELAIWGIDSGVRHSVSGSDYSSVRCGAFIGYRMIAEAAGLKVKPAIDVPHVVDVDDPLWHGYLANITPREFHGRFIDAVPEWILGREFLERYGGITDRVTSVDPGRTYSVRAPTLHPIYENERTDRFRALLQGQINEQSLCEMGQLMDAAHDSYTSCGLGSAGTDRIVALVRKAGPANGLYGSKITGGGSGGTVAILGRLDADEAVAEVAQRYVEQTGGESYVFRGSSPGAYETTVREVTI